MQGFKSLLLRQVHRNALCVAVDFLFFRPLCGRAYLIPMAAAITMRCTSLVPFYLIGSPFMPPAERDFLSPHQRKPFSMICNEPNANYQKAIEAYFDRKDILLNPPMKLQSIEAVKKSVMNHFGIAYVPLFSVEEELQDGSLIRLETELDEQFFPAFCVYHRNKWISPQMQLAFRILHEQLGIVFDEKENDEI